MSAHGWLDLGMGASGDMLLGALVGAGVPLAVLADPLRPLGIRLTEHRVTRAGLAAVQVEVALPDHPPALRGLAALLAVLDSVGAPATARAAASALAEAEAAVHATTVDEVHFHELGALDTVADLVGFGVGLDWLALARLTGAPPSVGGGTVASAHGRLPVPAPAVLELAQRHRLPLRGGPVDLELLTPTGAALLAVAVDDWGPLPPGTPCAVGHGAGTRDVPDRANIVRLVVTDPGPAAEPASEVLAANVDDLDPRVWPHVLAELLAAGAADAWLTPILMKKGRPAHTVSVLVDPARAEACARVLFRETTTIGLRRHPVAKTALPRRDRTVTVDGHPVRVKLAELDGAVVNAMPEYDDVLAAARATGRPVKAVLAEAARRAAEPG